MRTTQRIVATTSGGLMLASMAGTRWRAGNPACAIRTTMHHPPPASRGSSSEPPCVRGCVESRSKGTSSQGCEESAGHPNDAQMEAAPESRAVAPSPRSLRSQPHSRRDWPRVSRHSTTPPRTMALPRPIEIVQSQTSRVWSKVRGMRVRNTMPMEAAPWPRRAPGPFGPRTRLGPRVCDRRGLCPGGPATRSGPIPVSATRNPRPWPCRAPGGCPSRTRPRRARPPRRAGPAPRRSRRAGPSGTGD